MCHTRRVTCSPVVPVLIGCGLVLAIRFCARFTSLGKTLRNTRLLLGTQNQAQAKALSQTAVPYHLLHANDGREDGREDRGFPTEGKGQRGRSSPRVSTRVAR